ncbi:hypothetical protein CHLRE_09g395150v5 [Chlamydomonas reinhardtii]|uniref:Uncharacterized protein n=1 Tax=Chlamydomonas reinhardtii TaxID=3055 RepID=A0A2K3DD87_CHLRE|nr:uncharacterized protein CHLRE_09g395150v5 [Chlamydomonas reinhardtii]PNW78494.1 hypothetical protein CHLRE_09g395150v5 [Chlamydomonas reinhardtii]
MEVEQYCTALREMKITHILQVGCGLGPSHQGMFEYMVVPINDMENVDIVSKLPEMLSFIDKALAGGGVVLVHCMMGISRSASTVIAYLMWKERIGFVAAAQRVYAARPFISPNPGFVLQLRLWEKMGMDFAGWQGWSMIKFVQAMEDAGGLENCILENILEQQQQQQQQQQEPVPQPDQQQQQPQQGPSQGQQLPPAKQQEAQEHLAQEQAQAQAQVVH